MSAGGEGKDKLTSDTSMVLQGVAAIAVCFSLASIFIDAPDKIRAWPAPGYWPFMVVIALVGAAPAVYFLGFRGYGMMKQMHAMRKARKASSAGENGTAPAASDKEKRLAGVGIACLFGATLGAMAGAYGLLAVNAYAGPGAEPLEAVIERARMRTETRSGSSSATSTTRRYCEVEVILPGEERLRIEHSRRFCDTAERGDRLAMIYKPGALGMPVYLIAPE